MLELHVCKGAVQNWTSEKHQTSEEIALYLMYVVSIAKDEVSFPKSQSYSIKKFKIINRSKYLEIHHLCTKTVKREREREGTSLR